MKKLIIDGIVADLQDFTIALTKESNELLDFENKRSNLSNTIELPFTRTNDIIFKSRKHLSAFDPQIEFYDVVYIQDGTEIISKGKGILTDAVNSYKMNIYWGNIDIKARLGDKTLRDLDLEDLDHEFNLSNVANLKIEDDDFVDLTYPICNTNPLEELPTENIEGFRMIPFVSLRRILEQIQKDNDVKMEGVAIDEYLQTGRNLYIPVSERKDFKEKTIENSRTRRLDIKRVEQGEVYEGNFVASFIIDGESDFRNEFNIEDFDDVYEIHIDILKELRTHGSDGFVRYNYKTLVIAEFFDGATWDDYSMESISNLEEVLKGGVLGQYNNYNRTLTTGTSRNPHERRWRLESLTTKNLAGYEKVRFRYFFKFTNNLIAGSIRLELFFREKSFFRVFFENIRFGYNFKIAENLPEIEQIKILKYIASLTASLIDIEDGTNIIRFKRMEDLINSVNEAQDISHLVESWEVEKYNPDASQNNILKYDNHDDVPETLGTGVIKVNNETLSRFGEFYVAPFSATVNEIWNERLIAKLPMLEDWNDDFEDIKPRILQLVETDLDIDFIDNGNTITGTGKYIAQWNDSLSYETIVSQNYIQYQRTLNNYRLINARLNMTSEDFKRIDLLKTVFIKQAASYFLMNRMQNFVSGQKVQTKLTKL